MAEPATTESTAPAVTEPSVEKAEPTEVEKQAFLDRLDKESSKRKDAEKRASDLEKRLADLERDAEERATAGLPDLERERKARELAEKRATDAEKAKEEADKSVALSKAERLIVAAAKDFVDPEDAIRFVDLSEIEDADHAERAVKRVAKAKKHLLKPEEPAIPGVVLRNGQTAKPGESTASQAAIQEAEMLAAGLSQFKKD